MSKGTFIVVEGLDGVGKSTWVNNFGKLLREIYPERKIITTREPGGTPNAEAIRDFLLGYKGTFTVETELALILTARREHIDGLIRPELEQGSVVICDRFHVSTMGYQHGIKPTIEGSYWEHLRQSNFYIGDFRPDITFILEAPEAVRKVRLLSTGKTPDYFERRDSTFYQNVQEMFNCYKRLTSDTVFTVDTSGTEKENYEELSYLTQTVLRSSIEK